MSGYAGSSGSAWAAIMRRFALPGVDADRGPEGLALGDGPRKEPRVAALRLLRRPAASTELPLASQLDAVRPAGTPQSRGTGSGDQSRLRLIGFMSHDLKTPLASIRALSEALADGVVTDVPRTMAQMQQLVQRMTSLVDDLLALAQLEGPAPPRRQRALSLVDVIHAIADELRPVGTARRVTLEVLHGDDPLTVWGAPDDLARALSNLIMNAVRHTGPDRAVGIRADRTTGGGTRVSVIDGCGGIPDDHLPHVFDVGWRGTPVHGADEGGSGLGLAIARRIVQAHGGELTVRNVPGGCEFSIELPQACPDAA